MFHYLGKSQKEENDKNDDKIGLREDTSHVYKSVMKVD